MRIIEVKVIKGAMTRLMKFIYGEDQGNEAFGKNGRLNRGSTLRKGESTVSNMNNPNDDDDDENDKGKNFMNKDSDGKGEFLGGFSRTKY